uniref:PDZ domain-containing protein n=1 Tax=Solanum lycopersicum TaxID=4081 RepID=A0A3Q7F642_SOLLC
MEVTNLYAANLELLERIIPKLPDVLKGVIVEENRPGLGARRSDGCEVPVVPGSSAESAGVKHNDVIVHFGGTRIHSFLELFENMWNNVGESMELAVIRASHDVPVHLRMVVEEMATLEGMMTFEDSNILRVAGNGKMYGGSNMQCELS